MLTLEASIRLGAFAGVFGLMALWELAAPRRRLRVGKRRWVGNVGLTIFNTVVLRVAVPLGAYGVATVAALSLAVTMSLGQAWLTVALAVQLPAIAWIEGQLRLPALRGVIVVLALAVLVRLVLNHNVLDYPMGRYPGVNWLLYGYGIPAIAFFIAARWLRRSKVDWIVSLLEAGALVFLVLLVSLEIRHLMADGPLDARRYGLAEQSLQSISWAAIALVLYVREGADGRVVLKWGWRILGGLAAAQVLLWQVLVSNPLFTGETIGSVPVFNILLLAYGAPAVFAALFAVGALVMRGAGCTYNDIVDRDIDAKVARTRVRPIPSGAVSVKSAWAFLAGQLLVGLAILYAFNALTFALGVASLALVFTYPFMKRITYWPQAWLGLTFNWGALLGFAAVAGEIRAEAVLLYAGGFFWTLGYDTIYAHQDKADDLAVGVKSLALRLGAATVPWLVSFYAAAAALMAAAGTVAGLGWAYYPVLGLACAQLLWQANRVAIDDPRDCLAKFLSNRLFGWLVLAALVAGQATRAAALP